MGRDIEYSIKLGNIADNVGRWKTEILLEKASTEIGRLERDHVGPFFIHTVLVGSILSCCWVYE